MDDTTPVEATNETLLARQAARESNARTYPRELPLAISEAEGIEVVDADGNRYYDCLAGAGTLALGHNHPAVIEAMEDLLDRDRALHTLDITTPAKERFVDTLFDSLPDEFTDTARVHFCSPAGTDAVEAAAKLAKTATGNEPLLSFQGSYHGMTHGSLSLTGDRSAKADVSGLVPNVHFLPYPYDYRPPFGLGGEDGHRAISRHIERVLDDPESGVTEPAGVFVEAVQGEGGSIPAPDTWLRRLRELTRERDVPLIVDEIQAGLGRTGELYAFEHAGIVPDVVTLSKAVGGGLPLSVMLYDEEVLDWESGAHVGTFRGNQLAMAAGRATIEHIVENDLAAHATAMGERFMEHFAAIDERFAAVGDVRGRGLMLGLELVDPTADPDSAGSHPTDPDLAARVRRETFDRGLIVELGGRASATVRLLPPLIVTPEEVDEIASILTDAFAAAID
ncbi:diaminobutyrate--2-oxoglutarate transaminase [Halococcus agarilyticus]|uniref:diaminobutyrate--2-oxoglutarate transaminase n=1 Tax=Halococcus agarilyticus TaxID=1232219 RepID=UPI00067822BF|nr:diaminobutyrate--2-oxoglutarate transaminase [Halococcus agarilyticus]